MVEDSPRTQISRVLFIADQDMVSACYRTDPRGVNDTLLLKGTPFFLPGFLPTY